MVIVEFKSKYISYGTTTDSDIIEIAGGGELQKQKSKFSDKEEDILVLPVKHNGSDSQFSVYEKFKKPLVEAWGNESKEWVGKKFQIFHLNEKMEIKPLKI